MIISKSIKTLGCTTLLGAVLFTGLATAPAAHAATAESQANAVSTVGLRTITVSGYGEVTVQPDIAYIQLGLNTTGKTAQEAQEKNAVQFKAIKTALEKRNVPAKDIQTVRFSTMPDYSWDNNKQQLRGYQVEQIIQVTYRDLAGVGPLMDAATAAGANRIDNVSFSSEKMEAHRLDATDAALDNARQKAERIAKRAGVTIKGAVQISDGTSPTPPIMYSQVRADSMPASEKAINGGSQVYPGELKVGSSVTVTYSY
ncbi:SIMPL domain-containing protein [Aneurinibacillus aneurinilyticus]|jgi:uncharacterized protein YggE|uniref:SIMPL domain-containing protein n=2 Tax=Aneurinibacillus aneurinilyticus TaxID=1391 RepID=A0A848CW18_ANEAE|nr:SIMPL domain-containing protein [Aneurinibacillus aneurinilyticus]ERI11483.1 hypothetical protein HMPREF0083_00470 [Aneurinibacillus aneurinilyticus ATCC 12856]MCI1694197.1 SIMPL domain-containing protein [Aneurinibacillus aneurinilyticus]MED0707730.1 SIMPL domain-containing protein [Aneurinibacillus aneurinilyticus]MED0722395.1 SIMPL domain-containing protein [Aneurinibacillus aneurinilyticus]MED0733093.1 SIMPL domain-containing protein [Aneurinibacillus aneurinilyticus]